MTDEFIPKHYNTTINTSTHPKTSKTNNFEASGTGMQGTIRAQHKGSEGQQEPVIKLPFVGQQPAEGTLRYDVKIPLCDTFVYARQINSQELAELRKQNRKIEADGKPLSREKERLEREAAQLGKQELSDAEAIEGRYARIDAIESRLVEIANRSDELAAAEKALISDLVRAHVVAASWKEDGKEVFSREVEFSAIGDEIEIGQILVAYSQAGNGVLDALKAR